MSSRRIQCPPVNAAQAAADAAIIRRLEAVGGRYWFTPDLSRRRVYFECFRFSPDWKRGNGSGYYDVNARRFVSTADGLTNERFAEVIISRGPRWREDQSPMQTRPAADPEATGLDSMHSVIAQSDSAILLKAYVLDRPDLDASTNVGRVVYVHLPVQGRRRDWGWQGNLWRVLAVGEPFEIAGKNAVAKWGELLIYGEHLMRIDDGRGRAQPEATPPISGAGIKEQINGAS